MLFVRAEVGAGLSLDVSAVRLHVRTVHWIAPLVQWCVSVVVTFVETGRGDTAFEPQRY